MSGRTLGGFGATKAPRSRAMLPGSGVLTSVLPSGNFKLSVLIESEPEEKSSVVFETRWMPIALLKPDNHAVQAIVEPKYK